MTTPQYQCQSWYDGESKSVKDCTCGKCADAIKRPMNTKQIIQNMEKEFDRQFVKYNGRYIEDSFIDPNGLVGPVRKFIKEYTRSLLSAFAEEVIGENEEKDFPDYILPRNDLRQDQRLKVKEIISEIGK